MSSWLNFLDRELQTPYMQQLQNYLLEERARSPVYPAPERVFQAMLETPLDKVRVVILGQDPYHGPGQAMGLSFSVPPGVALPPSLRNIYKEIERDLGVKMSSRGDLTPWAQQGVLLLNTLLTVRQGDPLSHQKIGWETFTDHALQFLNEKKPSLAFLLWGDSAQKKLERALRGLHPEHVLILKAPHPSPLSAHRGFLGCSHFSAVNAWLESRGNPPIHWQL